MLRDINASLAESPYASWKVAWGPKLNDDRSNMLYIAGNSATNQYAVAVRGTDWSFLLDWLMQAQGARNCRVLRVGRRWGFTPPPLVGSRRAIYSVPRGDPWFTTDSSPVNETEPCEFGWK
jgi:hypothetical protein